MKKKSKSATAFGTHVLPRRGTEALSAYCQGYKALSELYILLIRLVVRADDVAETAHKALYDTEINPDVKQQLADRWSKRVTAVSQLKAVRQTLLEMMLCRQVDNTLQYFASLLFAIYVERPETLRSSSAVRVEFVLRHSSFSDLIRSLAERRVDKLAYRSFTVLCEHFSKQFGLSVGDEADRRLLQVAIETRNIAVHNRCRINERYVSRLNLGRDKIGQVRLLGIDELERLTDVSLRVISAMDAEARLKLRLRGVRFAQTGASRPKA